MSSTPKTKINKLIHAGGLNLEILKPTLISLNPINAE